MKTTLKVFLTISLFCSMALADGNQGSGGRPGTEPTKTTATRVVVIDVVISVFRQYLGIGF